MKNSPHALGFSLIQMAIVLTVIAVLAASMLPGGNDMGGVAQKDITVKRMVAIEKALLGYRTHNGALPCPADGSLATTNSNFGIQAANTGTCTGGTPAANFGPTSEVVGGVVPVRTLGLPDEYALDGWDRRFTYIVDRRATGGNNLTRPYTVYAYGSGGDVIGIYNVGHGINTADVIRIQGSPSLGNIPAASINGYRTVTKWDNDYVYFNAGTTTPVYVATDTTTNPSLLVTRGSCTTLTNAGGANAISIYNTTGGTLIATAKVALISHGRNGHGAFPANGSTVAGRIYSGSTDDDEENNASVLTNGSFTTNFDVNFIRKAETSTFDDIVRYGINCQ